MRMNFTAKKISERIQATASLASSPFIGINTKKEKTKKKKKIKGKDDADSMSTTKKTAKKKKVKKVIGLKTKYPQPVQDPNLKSCLKRPEATESSNSSVYSSSSFKCPKRSVAFGKIVITEFPIILGDNPAVTSGAPVTIDWVPQAERVYSPSTLTKKSNRPGDGDESC